MMPHVNHPEVIKDRIVVRMQLPSPGIKRILVVDTKMSINAQDTKFDQEKFDTLVSAVKLAMAKNDVDEAEIVSN